MLFEQSSPTDPMRRASPVGTLLPGSEQVLPATATVSGLTTALDLNGRGKDIAPMWSCPPVRLLLITPGGVGVTRLPGGGQMTGGLEMYVQDLALNLARRFPFEVHIVCREFPGNAQPQMAGPDWKGSLQIHPVPMREIHDWNAGREIRRIMRAVDPQVVHIH